MRILFHDYAGHPPQVQISRELARRGHTVLLLYAGSIQTPRATLTKQPGDSFSFSVEGVHLTKPFRKFSYIKRWFQEIEYGKLLTARIEAFHPDVVVSANTPLDSLSPVVRWCNERHIKFIFWMSDAYSLAIYNILKRKLPVIGEAIGRYYMLLERRLLRKSDEIVLITRGFTELTHQWKIDQNKVHVIPVWGPLEEISVQPKINLWSEKYGVATKFCMLYAGTLGMKHNPDLLLQLALRFKETQGIQIIVISEGLGANWLKAKKEEFSLDNIVILPYQPYEHFSYVLGSADVLVGILEPDACQFATPSKVLTYLCAKRALLLAMPPDSEAAQIVSQNQAGIVVHPSDIDGFIRAAETLVENPMLREDYAQNALAYAQKHFDIRQIGDTFEDIILR